MRFGRLAAAGGMALAMLLGSAGVASAAPRVPVTVTCGFTPNRTQIVTLPGGRVVGESFATVSCSTGPGTPLVRMRWVAMQGCVSEGTRVACLIKFGRNVTSLSETVTITHTQGVQPNNGPGDHALIELQNGSFRFL